MIDISGLSKATVLAALHNASHPQGMGILHYDPNPVTVTEAQALLDASPTKYFDNLKGRVMKVSFMPNDAIDPRLYDRDNGPGAAAKTIQTLRGA